MIEVIPAIMPKSFADLREHALQVVNATPLVQLDIMDGKFVPSRSWPYGKEDENFGKVLSEEEGLPFWDQLDYEIDLMVENPEEVIADWVTAGAKRIIVHFESVPDFGSFLENFRKEYGSVKDSALTPELGVALGMETPIESITPFLNDVDFVQFMAIDTIGVQAQPFDVHVLEKIMNLRKDYPDTIISVDGGVNFESAPYLVEVGVNRLVSGSTIFQSENIIETIEMLQNLGEEE